MMCVHSTGFRLVDVQCVYTPLASGLWMYSVCTLHWLLISCIYNVCVYVPQAVMYKTYTTKSDTWSYGCVLFEIWSLGLKPYPDLAPKEVLV